jgi:hypothetical protein
VQISNLSPPAKESLGPCAPALATSQEQDASRQEPDDSANGGKDEEESVLEETMSGATAFGETGKSADWRKQEAVRRSQQ